MPLAIVTGGNRGIGWAIVQALLAKGYEVVSLSKTGCLPPGPAHPKGLIFGRVDLAKQAEIYQAVQGLQQKLKDHDGLDLLVNNAGMLEATPLGLPPVKNLERFQAMMQVNVLGPTYLTEVLRDSLVRRAGSIVTIGSILGDIGYPDYAGYAATKAALASLAKTWAVQLGRFGIRSNLVCPGPTNTDMLKDMPPTPKMSLAQRTPLGRLCRPEAIARAVLFLASSEDSGDITGASLTVDGGLLIAGRAGVS